VRCPRFAVNSHLSFPASVAALPLVSVVLRQSETTGGPAREWVDRHAINRIKRF